MISEHMKPVLVLLFPVAIWCVIVVGLIDVRGRIRTDLSPERPVYFFLDRGEDRRHRIGMVAGSSKLITGADMQTSWLYDLELDRGELQDIAPALAEKRAEMQ